MKLKSHIQEHIHLQKYSIIFIFLVGMAAMTVISRAADSFMVPQVSIASPDEMKLKYPLEIQGRIAAKENQAVCCLENLRIAQVAIQPNDIVKKGDLLFSIDLDDLKEKIQQTEQEIQKLSLQIKDLEQSYLKQASQQSLSLSRAEEDYNDISNRSEASVNAAYQELENARNELALHDSQKPNITEPENARGELAWHDSQKPNITEPENARDELAQHSGQKPKEGTEQDYADNNDTEKTEGTESAQEAPASQDIQASGISEEQSPLDEWLQKHEELEQACLEKQKLYEDASAARNEALKTAARQIEDAGQPLTKDSSAALLQIEEANLAHTLQELKELRQAGGKICSEYDGQIEECTISTGSITSSEPVIILSDFSQPFQFEGTLNDIEESSIETLHYAQSAEGALKMEHGNILLEHVKISSISQEEDGSWKVTADLGSHEISSTGEAALDITRESKQYPCCIPLSALYSQESGDFVIRIKEKPTILGIQSTAEYVPITLLEKNGQYAAVEGNLSSSDRLIVNASKPIKEGDRIRIIEN